MSVKAKKQLSCQPPSRESDEIKLLKIAKPSSKATATEKSAWRKKMATGVIAEMCKRGTIVQNDGTPLFIPNPGKKLSRFPLEKGNLQFETFMYSCTQLTPAEYDFKVVAEHVRLQASKKAEARKIIHFSQYQNLPSIGPSVLLSDANGALRASAIGIERLKENAAGCYIEPIGLEWKYTIMSADELAAAGRMYKLLFADSQSCSPQSRIALAVALPLLTFIRQRLDMRPIFHFSGGPGAGKSFGSDRFSYLLYGESALVASTAAALRRDTDPFLILDDVEKLPGWMKDHLRKASTGIRQKSVRSEQQVFQVENANAQQPIYVLTAIRIPTDPALLTRTWFFNYAKAHFNPEFKNEMKLREQILEKRDVLMSFWAHLLSETLKSENIEGLPDLCAFEPLPAQRTQHAQAWLLLCLRAFDRLSPNLFDPAEEFKGFVEQQRSEDATRRGQTTDELTLLDQLMEKFELGRENGWHLDPEVQMTKLKYEDNAIIGSATAIGESLRQQARQQGMHIRSEFNGVNIGRWLSSEVSESAEFTAEECSVGTGMKKRKAWRIARRNAE